MIQLTLVTGNKGKLREWQRLLPDGFAIDNVDIDLAEIQSLNPEEIVVDKAMRAFEILKKLVLVEDVSAGLDKFGGLPGPFIKFFFKKMGEDALRTLAGKDGERARVGCTIAFYDGETLLTVKGEVSGVVVSPRGQNGFGFDKVFLPENSKKTFGEMTDDEKDTVSHRAVAIQNFIHAFQTSTING
jgi:inosine triphosphate pyrophosphatase